jgi:hypothetical protein
MHSFIWGIYISHASHSQPLYSQVSAGVGLVAHPIFIQRTPETATARGGRRAALPAHRLRMKHKLEVIPEERLATGRRAAIAFAEGGGAVPPFPYEGNHGLFKAKYIYN